MSLTKDDFKAIKNIVDGSVDSLRVDVAAGFVEVHEKISDVAADVDELQATANRIENKLDATADKVDDHEFRLKRLEKKPA